MTEATTLDGDVASFFAGQELKLIFVPEDLRSFLIRAGHGETDAVTTVERWQVLYLEEGLNGRWRLNAAGRALVLEIRKPTVE